MLFLSVLDKVKTTQISDALDIAIQKNESASTTLSHKRPLWELCEACFIDKTTTAEERQLEIDSQIKAGRSKGETYEEYASRMQYIFRVYRVDNTSTSTLAQLRKTFSPWVRTSMNIFFCMYHPNDSNKHPNTLLEFCEYLTRIEGPDEKRELTAIRPEATTLPALPKGRGSRPRDRLCVNFVGRTNPVILTTVSSAATAVPSVTEPRIVPRPEVSKIFF